MVGIARYRRAAPAVGRRQHAAADAAIGAGGARWRAGADRPRSCQRSAHAASASERPNIMSARMAAIGCSGADQFEIPERVADIADQDRAGQAPVRDHQFLVGAVVDIGEHDALAAVSAHEIAGREHADAGNFQVGRDDAAAIGSVLAGEVPRQHPRLLVGRFDQAIADAAMLGAFADRKHIGARRSA